MDIPVDFLKHRRWKHILFNQCPTVTVLYPWFYVFGQLQHGKEINSNKVASGENLTKLLGALNVFIIHIHIYIIIAISKGHFSYQKCFWKNMPHYAHKGNIRPSWKFKNGIYYRMSFVPAYRIMAYGIFFGRQNGCVIFCVTTSIRSFLTFVEQILSFLSAEYHRCPKTAELKTISVISEASGFPVCADVWNFQH